MSEVLLYFTRNHRPFKYTYICSAEVFFTSHYAAITSTVLICAYISFYPRAAPWRAGFGTSAQILGPWYGCSLGLSLASNHFPKVYKDLIGFLKGDFKQDTIHICIALILVSVTKVGTKIIARKILLFLQRRGVLPVSKSELVDIYGNTVAPEKAYYVEVSSCFFKIIFNALQNIVYITSV